IDLERSLREDFSPVTAIRSRLRVPADHGIRHASDARMRHALPELDWEVRRPGLVVVQADVVAIQAIVIRGVEEWIYELPLAGGGWLVEPMAVTDRLDSSCVLFKNSIAGPHGLHDHYQVQPKNRHAADAENPARGFLGGLTQTGEPEQRGQD